jgi:hypothetical protein
LLLVFLLQNHQVTSSLPPLPEGGEVDDRYIVADDAQGTSRPESEVAGSHKSSASSERETESEASEYVHSLPSAVSPKNKRKGMRLQTLAPPKPANHLPKKLPPKRRKLSTLTMMPSLARKLLYRLFSFDILIFECAHDIFCAQWR